MSAAFIHDVPSQRVVFAAGAVTRIGDEAARLGMYTRARHRDARKRRAARQIRR